MLIKVYDVANGDYIMEYYAPIAPNVGDTIFIEELQVKVANVYHIVRGFEQFGLHSYSKFERVEIEVEVIDCIYCDIEMDIGSVELTENGEEVVSFVCPMCETVAIFLKELKDDSAFVN